MKNRILITGGAGFIGSHLAEELLSNDYFVTVIDNLSTGSLENLRDIQNNPKFKLVIDTILDEVVMDRLVSECDIVFHLAAAVGVRLIVDKPVQTIQTNIMGTELMMRIAKRYGVKVMLASTSEVYGKGNKVPFSEDDDVVLGPTSKSRWSYAASKMVDEFLGLAYADAYDQEVVIFRLFNTVGPRQSGLYGMVIPRFVEQVINGQPLTVYSDGKQKRCFMHVNDAVDAMLMLMVHKETSGKVFNIGSTEEITISDLANKIIRKARSRFSSKSEVRNIPYEDVYAEGFEDMDRRVPDISKIQSLIEWEPKFSLDNIIDDILAYEMENNTDLP